MSLLAKYEVKIQGPYAEPSQWFQTIREALTFLHELTMYDPLGFQLLPGERMILRQIDTGKIWVIRDNGYVCPEKHCWLQEGF